MGTTVEHPTATERENRVVTRGRLQGFGVISVLHALSLSRQYTAVELFGKDGKIAGRVTLKAGMVLEASIAGSTVTGSEAFQQLIGQSLEAFQVERLPPQSSFPEPIGHLSTQLHAPRSGHLQVASPPESTRRSSAPTFDDDSAADVAIRESQRPPAVGSGAPQPQRPTSRPRRLSTVPPAKPREAVRRRAAPAEPIPIVAIASPKGGCGKTTISLNLAVALARTGLRVTLVDADPNGDVLSALASRARSTSGVFDALALDADASTMLIQTAVPGLSVVPAMGEDVASSLQDPAVPDSGMWRRLLEGLPDADVVLVDLPAGMFGMSGEVLGACSHVVGVLQADVVPKRSFEMFRRALDARIDAPEVLGVILNMFERSLPASVSVLLDAGDDLPSGWLLETTIPRNRVFSDANEQGLPVSMSEAAQARTIGVLFDAIADELRTRLGIAAPSVRQPKAFLL